MSPSVHEANHRNQHDMPGQWGAIRWVAGQGIALGESESEKQPLIDAVSFASGECIKMLRDAV